MLWPQLRGELQLTALAQQGAVADVGGVVAVEGGDLGSVDRPEARGAEFLVQMALEVGVAPADHHRLGAGGGGAGLGGGAAVQAQDVEAAGRHRERDAVVAVRGGDVQLTVVRVADALEHPVVVDGSVRPVPFQGGGVVAGDGQAEFGRTGLDGASVQGHDGRAVEGEALLGARVGHLVPLVAAGVVGALAVREPGVEVGVGRVEVTGGRGPGGSRAERGEQGRHREGGEDRPAAGAGVMRRRLGHVVPLRSFGR
ncbi:hypothetical protein GCM10020221_20130 [Streptomyces thioluteus]|uniref:Uncharacterized protein n=1 Tax=Streptomyces thioluteus TaxID=66431 RepID=A0ABN3WST0_STRTU